MGLERRVSQDLSVQVRGDSDKKRTIEGYASVSGVPTVIWYFEEVIAKGAFTRALEELERGEQDVRSLFNHDANYVLGRTKRGDNPGTLSLREDDKGLWTVTNPPALGESPMADSVVASIRRGDVSGMSFAFTVRKQEWEFFEYGSEQLDRRTITEVGILYDIGPVTYPAYDQTTVGVRMRNDAKKEHDEARNRWTERKNSRIVVPKEFENSLHEMRSGDAWVNSEPEPEVAPVAEPQAKIDEETNVPTITEDPNATQIVGEAEAQEAEKAGDNDPVEAAPEHEGNADVEGSVDVVESEGEARSRQISLKKRIQSVSAKTRASLDK